METEHAGHGAAAPDAVPVHVGHDVPTQTQAADFGGWLTFTTPAGADVPRALVQYDRRRYRATLIVNGAAGGVYVGTREQCQASPPAGGFLPAGTPGLNVQVQNKQSLWMVGDGAHACTVTVLAERWDQREE